MPQQYLETTHHSVNWFAQADEADQLDIAPSFQRRPVWSQRQKSDLIGTMLLGYPIPELYINEVVSGDGDETYSLIDGQQRIRAALEFLNGKFALDASDGVPISAHGSRFEDLGEAERRAIRNYKLVVRTLRDVDETVIREMFRRLNQGVVALNDQELRHATYEGPFLVLMEKLADEPLWSEFGIFSADDIRRMRDVEFVSEVAIMLLNGPQNKKLTLDRWYQTYEDSFEEATELHALVERVLHEVQAILPDLKRTRWKKRSDFYSLTGALGRHQAALPLSSEQRSQLRLVLLNFGEEVDRAVRATDAATLQLVDQDSDQESLEVPMPGDAAAAPQTIAERYADAVERAATDLSRRRVREEILYDLIGTSLSETTTP
ncbi:DUF262 domain-containing protein [Microbacterium sp. p3-SID338]|uniref:DUF262 domain-containing protein n=1 Tax=Microbacterium sp. p3-SID338 TaxID=2916214 RepID=UPI0021A30525|nr:DUF262 domain-containing protein [Microbacterium sp. p3-SID338]MCT1396662.1 DUF262 domain-containing protein [Microbacterium sp. p3-SID338]